MDNQKPRASRKRSRRRGRRRKKQKIAIEETWPTTDTGLTILKFSACTQCGYFLTGYRAQFGLDWLDGVIANAEHNWLDLGWHRRIPALLAQSYNLHTDGTPLQLEHCCTECHRILLVAPVEQPETAKPEDEQINRSRPDYKIVNLAIQIMPNV